MKNGKIYFFHVSVYFAKESILIICTCLYCLSLYILKDKIINHCCNHGPGEILSESGTITNLYIARHGQTKWNVEHRIQGKTDSPLTDLGITQARQLGKRLSKVDLDVIYSSSSQRALKTAQMVGEKQKTETPLHSEDDLMEIALGEWEGMLRKEVDQLYPRLQSLYFNKPAEFQPVGNGETFLQVKERVMNFLNRILERNSGKNILVVTHTAVVKLILGNYEGRSLDRLWDPPIIHPASLSLVELNGSGQKIKIYGDTRHFKQYVV